MRKITLQSIFLSSVLVGGLMFTPAVYAEGSGMEKSEGFHKMAGKKDKKIQKIYQQLNLTEDQKKLLEENKKANRLKKKELFGQMKAKKEALQQELMKSDFDVNKVQQINAEIKQLQSEMSDMRLDAILGVRKILTQEQFVKFNELMEKNRKDKGWGK